MCFRTTASALEVLGAILYDWQWRRQLQRLLLHDKCVSSPNRTQGVWKIDRGCQKTFFSRADLFWPFWVWLLDFCCFIWCHSKILTLWFKCGTKCGSTNAARPASCKLVNQTLQLPQVVPHKNHRVKLFPLCMSPHYDLAAAIVAPEIRESNRYSLGVSLTPGHTLL